MKFQFLTLASAAILAASPMAGQISLAQDGNYTPGAATIPSAVDASNQIYIDSNGQYVRIDANGQMVAVQMQPGQTLNLPVYTGPLPAEVVQARQQQQLAMQQQLAQQQQLALQQAQVVAALNQPQVVGNPTVNSLVLDATSPYLGNPTVPSYGAVIADQAQAAQVTATGYVNPFTDTLQQQQARLAALQSGQFGAGNVDQFGNIIDYGTINLQGASPGSFNRYAGGIVYDGVLQQNPAIADGQTVGDDFDSDMFSYSPNAGRSQADNFYQTDITRQRIDRDPIIAGFDQQWQRQYAVTSEITRQLDYQNRDSGWRLVGAPQPAAPVAAPAPPPAPRQAIAIENIYFDFDMDFVRPAEMNRVAHVAAILQANPQYTVLVSGHTDAAGTDAYNVDLSIRRSTNAANALVGLGIAPQRIRLISSGEAQTIAPPAQPNGAQQINRRVTFSIMEGDTTLLSSGR